LETLRIAIITETLPPAELNLQPWRYLGDLARALQAEGHETSVVTSQVGAQKWNEVSVKWHRNPTDYRSAVALHRVLETERFDIGVCRLTAGLFFSTRRVPREASFRGRLIGIFLRPLHSGTDLARRFLDPTMAAEIPHDRHHAALYVSRLLGTWPGASAFVNNFVFLWESDRDSAKTAGLPPSSCTVVRHPFDPFFLERGPPNLGPRLSEILGRAGRRVVFTGPPEGSRGVDDMLRLAHFLPRDPPTQVVLFLRDRRFSDPRVERTRIGSHELLVVRGLLSRQELRAAYRASDLAVFPYRFVRTGLPLVALEAVATGLPVVTTRVHPIRELEGRTGLVFAEPRDPSDLATRIREVFENDALNGIRRRNEEWIRTSPDWKAAARTFVSLAER
jgi:glycosyltransferase involved in cell wall biosynthesis